MIKSGKRRIALALMLIVAVFAIALALPGCFGTTCEHKNTTTTCTATCTETGIETVTCNDCNTVISTKEVAALGHDYQEDTSKAVAATCTEKGSKTYVCSRCGDSYEDEIPATGHDYHTTTVDATCTEQGYTLHTCSGCGDSYKTDYTDIIDHTYTTEVTAPTCTAQGYTTYTCSDCGHSYTANYTEALSHDYHEDESKAVAPTCTEKGSKTYVCSNCGHEYTEVIGATNHHYVVYETVAATCTTQGYTTYKCTDCDDEYKADYTAVIAHKYTTAVTDPTCTAQGYTTYTCSACGHYYYDDYVDALGHDYQEDTSKRVEATCTENGSKTYVCSRCTNEYTEVIGATDHHYTTTVVAPTCTEKGYTIYKCTDGDDEYTADFTDMIAHNYTAVVTAPTCTAQGYTTYTCSECGYHYDGDYVDALDHDYKEDTSKTVAATCTEKGSITYVCSHCGVEYTEEVAAKSHSYTTTVVAPTCTAQGYTIYTCTACGDSYNSDYTDMIAHTYTSVVTAPTCTEKGYTTYTCSECGYSYVDNYTDAIGHNYEVVATVAATCTTQGYTTYKCSHCDDTVNDDIVAATGHTYVDVTTDPTCLDKGYTTYTCSCGDSYVGDYVAALGHDWVGASCEERHCSHDGCTATLAATTAHTYEEISRVEATCTSDGSITYGCSGCHNDDYNYTETIKATGHTYATDGDGNIIWADTTDEPVAVEGKTCTYTHTHTATCSTCGATITEEYEYVSHNYCLKETKEATCTEAGTKAMVCSDCEAVLEGSEVSYYAEHSYDEGTQYDGYILYKCTNEGCTNTKTTYTETSATVTSETLQSDVELGGGAVISMSEEAVASISDTSSLTLSANVLDSDDYKSVLSEEEQEKVGDSNVYNITLSDGETNITEFNGGYVTVKLPYTLSDGEDESTIVVYYISDSGLESFNAVYTEDENGNGYVTFETNHFSYYTVGKYSAADLCKKYGHEIIGDYKVATCTTDGYCYEYCTRCKEVITNEVYPATGHDYETTSYVAATCTTNGVATYTCSVCNESHTSIIVATGHKWVKQGSSEAATCQHSGHNDYACSECEASYSEDLAQLSHNYVVKVTAPTCTEMGYTTYTCSSCGDSYVTDYVDALGHMYSTTATCTDRECFVCGEKLPATSEHHYGDDGVCTECGYGCEHEYTKTTVEATCTSNGYTTYTCSKCGKSYIDDYVAACGHDYSDSIESCSVCGAANPDLVSIFNTIVANSYSLDYTVKLTDATLTVVEDEVYNGYKYEYTYVVKNCELYFSYQDGTVIIYGDGDLVYTMTRTSDSSVRTYEYEYAAKIYGDGEFLYIYAYADEEEQVVRVSYEYALGDYYDIIFADEEAIAQYKEMIETYLENELVQSWLTILQSHADEANSLAADVFYTLFSGNATEDGYQFTLNLSLLHELNENLNNLTVSELVDEYFGDGTYTALSDYIAGLEDKTLYDLVTEVLLYGEKLGIDKELVFTTINTIVEVCGGVEGFDIESYLVSDDDEVIGNMTIAQILTDYAGLDSYSDIINALESFKEINIYKSLFGSDVDIFYDAVAMISNGNSLALVFTTDSDYNVSSVKVILNNAEYSVSSYITTWYAEGNTNYSVSELYSTTTITVNGTLGVEYTCTLPEGYDSYKTQIEAAYAKVIASIKAACEDSEDGTCSTNDYIFSTDEDGNVYITYWIFEDDTIYTIDINDVAYLVVESDCANCYNVVIGRRYQYGGGLVSSRFYVDAENNELLTESPHDYVLVENPEGVPSSADEVDCEEYYYIYYQCTRCGDTIIDAYYKDHEYAYEYEFVNADSKDCDDGVIVTEYCTVCGEELGSWTDYGHCTYLVGVYELTCTSSTENGITYIYYYSCACGGNWWVDYGYNGYGCDFNDVMYYKTLYDDDGETAIGYVYKYNCCYTGCGNYYLWYNYYCNTAYSNDYREYYQYNAETGGAELVCTIYTGSDGHSYSFLFINETDDNGNTIKSGYSDTCKFCGDSYSYFTTYSYDDNGNKISQRYEQIENGVVTYWYQYNYTYDGNILMSCYYTNSNGNNHSDTYEYTYEYDEDNNLISRTVKQIQQYSEYTRTYTTIYNSDGMWIYRCEKTTYTYGYEYSYTYEYDSYGREIYYYYSETYSDGSNYWESRTWEYNGCHYTITHLDSDGDTWIDEEGENHGTETWYEDYNDTCTQPNTYGWVCDICGEVVYGWSYVNGHSWYYDSDLGCYVCSRCGLESEQGSSSDIILEDLTNNSTYGKDDYVAIGYYSYSDIDFDIAYSLVPVNSQSDLDLDLGIDIDLLNVEKTSSILYISLSELKAIAEEKGVSLTEYDLRVLFNNGSYTVTGITITDLVAKEAIISTIIAVLEAEETGTYAVDDYITLGLNEDGTVYLTWVDNTAPDISEYGVLTYESDCTGTYCVIIEYTYANGDWFHVEFYVDVINGKISIDTFHSYEVTDNPDGMPTYEEAGCGEYYYVYYKCSVCGDVYYDTYYKGHCYTCRYELAEGSESCEDGIIITEYCTVCGEELESWTDYGHYTYLVEEYDLICNSTGGSLQLVNYTCACGEYYYGGWRAESNGCEFESDGKGQTIIYDGETAIGYYYKYVCINDGCCNYYIEYYYYCNTTYGDNRIEYYQYNTETQEYILVFTRPSTSNNHEYGEVSYTEGTDENGYITVTYTYTCIHCGYVYSDVNGYECDESGRVIYSYFNRVEDGEVVSWNESYYTYEGEATYWSERKTTNSYGDCFTWIYQYDDFGRVIYYYDSQVSSDGYEYWYSYTYTYESEDSYEYVCVFENSYGDTREESGSW